MKENDHLSCKCKNTAITQEAMARREFLLRTLAAGAAGAWVNRRSYGDIASLYASGRVDDKAAIEEALEAWSKDLFDPGRPRRYSGNERDHIAMPLGGIGAGQLYLTGRGTPAAWQLCNNFRIKLDDACGFFAVHTRDARGKIACRKLSTEEADENGVSDIRATCEYPFMTLAYQEQGLPVEVFLEAWSPFEPLNTKDSGLPGALFTFSVHNRRDDKVAVSLMAALQNRIGWDGYTEVTNGGINNIEYEGNCNRFIRREDRAMVSMSTRTGTLPSLSKPCTLVAPDYSTAHLMRLCKNVTVTQHMKAVPEDLQERVVWLGPGAATISESELEKALDATEKGASLVIADNGDGLLGLLAGTDADKPWETLYDDFESGGYDRWKIEGNCFGEAPARGTLPGQQPVDGYKGEALLNTFLPGDDGMGRAVSGEFTIAHRYIHFLIGGGNHPKQCRIDLIVDDETTHSATGRNEERLQWRTWEVGEWLGKRAHFEIMDEQQGGWGHINVDHILFSNQAVPPFLNPGLAERLRTALPFEFAGMTRMESPATVKYVADEFKPCLPESCRRIFNRYRFDALTLKGGARILAADPDNTPLAVVGPYGAGRILVYNGLCRSNLPGPRQRDLIGGALAFLRDATHLPQTGWPEDSPPYGTVTLGAWGGDGPDRMTAWPQWEDEQVVWNVFAKDGTFKNTPKPEEAGAAGRSWNAAVAAQFDLEPGESKLVTFFLAWHFPNRTRDHRYGWGPAPFQYDHRLGNRYNRWFKDANEVAAYLASEYERHLHSARTFHDALYAASLPRWLLDAVSANIAALRSPLYMWLEDGTVAAFEGTDACCPMNCTHVFNYVMTPAFLFPELERNVRETDWFVQMHPTEPYIPHRTVLPLSEKRLGFEIGGPHHPALDGELGTILKTYREWRQCGDRAWLERVFPAVKKHLRYLMRTHDAAGEGVIRGEQPNTYDIHTYGSNTFIGTLYLAALRAAEEMALLLGENAFARFCRNRFERGRAAYDAICWNGEYYANIYDAPHAGPNTYNEGNCWGAGCHADQLLGQWWANILGLGYLLPREHVRSAVQAIYRHCWRGRLDLPKHHQRVFADPWERGLVNCAWPQDGRPEHPVLYCDEVWTGIEYEVAALLLQEGFVKEGLQVVKAARDRYTGNQRNPFSEIECGGHYARALSSYALLNAAAGLLYDAGTASLVFKPKITPHKHRAFFTAATGYGRIEQHYKPGGQRICIVGTGGEITLRRLYLELPESASSAILEGRVAGTVDVQGRQATVSFDKPCIIRPTQFREIVLSHR